MKLSILVVLLVATVCVIEAMQEKREKTKSLVRIEKKKLQGVYAKAKTVMKRRHQEKRSNQNEKRLAPGECVAARCFCDDYDLVGGFLATVGNVVASCRVSHLYFVAGYYGIEPFNYPHFYDFYGEVCDLMYGLAVYYENYGYLYEPDYEPQTFEESVHIYESIPTCCDMRELLITFGCVQSYLSLHEVAVAELFHTKDTLEEITLRLEEELEDWQLGQCNATFYSDVCLGMSITGNSELENCNSWNTLLSIPHEELVSALSGHEQELIETALQRQVVKKGDKSDPGSSTAGIQNSVKKEQNEKKELKELERLLLNRMEQKYGKN